MFTLLPRDLEFFSCFEGAADNAVRAAELLAEVAQADAARWPGLAGAIKEMERNGDRFTHQALDRLDQTYITPIDRDDIHALITEIDDVVDAIDATAQRLLIYRIQEVTSGFREQCDTLTHATQQMRTAIRGLRDLKKRKQKRKSDPDNCIESAIIAVHKLENESDETHHRVLGDLFECGFDPFQVIKWKELYELVEMADDYCEDVANTLQGIVLKNA